MKLVEPPAQPSRSSPSETPAALTDLNGARFTRASPLERWNARAARGLSAIGASRYGVLSLGAVIVALALAVVGLAASRGSSDQAAIQADKAQIARLTTERDQAMSTAARAGNANAAAQAQLERWRSLAVAERRAAGVGKPSTVHANRAGHHNRAGGGR